MGAGILPVAIHNKKLMFLFGRENKYADTPGWSDFGGGPDKGETIFETAIREGYEELSGILGSKTTLKSLVKKNMIHKIHFNKYAIFIFKIKYDETLPKHFNLMNKFIERNIPDIVKKHNGLFEKSEIKWFSLEELKNKKHLFRNYYRKYVNSIISFFEK